MNVLEQVWTRRRFVQAGACAGVACALPASSQTSATRYAVAAFSAENPRLRSFRLTDAVCQQVDTVTLPPTAHLCAHPSLPVVYACHDADLWEHLPRGVVSAWGVRQTDGVLLPLGTQPLSLAATRPHFATVIAGGSALLVLTRAGIYNVVSLLQDGRVDQVTAMRKEYGSAGEPAFPRHAVEHADGTLFAVDSGQGTISRYRLFERQLLLQHRLHAGIGMQRVSLSHDGELLHAFHAHHGRTSVHRLTNDAVLAAHGYVPGNRTSDVVDIDRMRTRAPFRGCTAFTLCGA